MEQPTQVKVPNPKRVEAGKRAAEARRAKKAAQEMLLAELQAEKTELRTALEAEKAESLAESLEPQPHRAPRRAPDYTPWIVGGLGVARVVLFGYTQKPAKTVATAPAPQPIQFYLLCTGVKRSLWLVSAE